MMPRISPLVFAPARSELRTATLDQSRKLGTCSYLHLYFAMVVKSSRINVSAVSLLGLIITFALRREDTDSPSLRIVEVGGK